MRRRIITPRVSVQLEPNRLGSFHKNVLEAAGNGKEFSIGILVEAVCQAHAVPHLPGSSPSSKPPSILSLVYDEDYHQIFVQHNDVTKGVIRSQTKSPVAQLLSSLLNLYEVVQSQTNENHVHEKMSQVKRGLTVFSDDLKTLGNRVLDPPDLLAYQKLYAALIELVDQITSANPIVVNLAEDELQQLPRTLRSFASCLIGLNDLNAYQILASPDPGTQVGLTGSNSNLPVEGLIAKAIVLDYWLLEGF